jgi:site-specific DNA recombinase
MERRAVIYTRISRDPEHDELGVTRQRHDCEQLCEREGFNVVEVLQDDDRSAYSGKRRPGYERLHQLLAAREVDVVVAWHPDRLTRHPRELETLIEALEAASATVRTVTAGELDLSTPAGRMTARVVGAVARHESEHKSQRLRRKHQELAEAGKLSGGGTRPFGYEDDRVTIRPDEAAIITELAERYLAGATLRSLAVDLDRRGIRTSAGKQWTVTAVQNTLLSARNAGLRMHSKGATDAVWPAIISKDDHRRIVAMAEARKRSDVAQPRKYLLTGVLVCSLCGARLVARPRGDRRRCYVCANGVGYSGCGKIRTLSEPVEELVVATVLAVLADMDLTREPERNDDALLAALNEVDQRQQELGTMWAEGEIDRAGWNAASRAMDQRRKALEDQIARQGRAKGSKIAVDAAMASRWSSLSFDQQRAVIGHVVDRIVVAPALKGRNFFDPNRVSIIWKA